jgi:16S rRNA (cytosine1402-N4)-methyltransferase
MRMDRTQDITAGQILAQWSQEELGRLFFEYGDERWAKRIAARIVETRRHALISTTTQLAAIVSGAIPRKMWPKGIHPATRVFQALRIQVNEELDQIGPMIKSAVRRLRPGGRIACISFHSLEDRSVKHVYRELSGVCTCPPRLPVCQCGAKKTVNVLTQRPVFCSDLEAAANYRARSARMRVAERV